MPQLKTRIPKSKGEALPSGLVISGSGMGKLLLPMLPKGHFTIESFDSQDKLTQKLVQRYKAEADSWVRNAYNIAFMQLGAINGNDTSFGAGYLNVKRADGGTISHGAYPFGMDNAASMLTAPHGYTGAAGALFGLVAGTSDTTGSDFERCCLVAIIPHGSSGAGNLAYQAGETPTYAYTPGTLTLDVTHKRYLNNNSGGTITVKEIGIYAQLSGLGGYGVMVERTILGAPVSVLDTGQLLITYDISLVYPA